MKPTLHDFHQILSGNLKPWTKTHSDDRYQVLLKECTKPKPIYSPSYSLDFRNPFNTKTRFYEATISNARITYLNKVGSLFFETESENIRINVIHHALQKELLSLLRTCAQIIENEQYDPRFIDTSSLIKTSTDNRDNTFILHLIKANLVLLYIEIQNLGEDYLQTDFVEIEDLYFQIFKEAQPTLYSIDKSLESPTLVNRETQPRKVKKEASGFKAIRGDLEGTKTTLVTYDNVANRDLFATVEENLHDYGFIGMDYDFIKNKKESNNRNLAAILRVLIERNFFRRNIIGTPKKATDNEIRKYIESRYTCDISQEFRRLKDHQVEAAKSKYRWLDQIDPLR